LGSEDDDPRQRVVKASQPDLATRVRVGAAGRGAETQGRRESKEQWRCGEGGGTER
jgi:hypothetical protein